jgi:hypothetical protein
VALHCQIIDVEQRVERCAPWHLVEPQRDRAAHPLARDDIQSGELGECLEHGAQLGSLEVQGDRFVVGGKIGVGAGFGRSAQALAWRQRHWRAFEDRRAGGFVACLVGRSSSQRDGALGSIVKATCVGWHAA